LNPDVVCFQEATIEFLNEMKSYPFFQKNYVASDVDTSTFEGSYGVVILTKFEVQYFSLMTLYTRMGRKMISFDLEFDNKEKFAIGTVHLESLDSRIPRKSQLYTIQNFSSFKDTENVILCGDFNFDSQINWNQNDARPLENKFLENELHEYQDVWTKLRKERGITFDSVINKNIDVYEQMRYDRVMLKSQHWHASKIDMICDKPFLKLENRDVFPSDHFGLHCIITKKIKKIKEKNY